MINLFNIKESTPPVWQDVLQVNDFSEQDFNSLKADADSYAKQLAQNFDPVEGIKKIVLHQSNKAKEVSPLWRYWSADHSVTSKVDFDYSSNLTMQNSDSKDKDRMISDPEEIMYPGSLMCCDVPERTVGFLLSTFAKEHGLTLGERLSLSAELSRYVNLMMQIAFIWKWVIKWARPANYQISQGSKTGVSLIPHPNHGSLPSGHSTIGQAVKKRLTRYAQDKGITLSRNWLQLCDEVGIARITVGIHWWADHEAAIHIVDQYDDMVMKYVAYYKK